MRLIEAYEQLRTAAEEGPVPAELLRAVREAEERADLGYLVDRVPGAFNRSLEGIDRVASIVGAMRQLAHPPTVEMEPVDLGQLIETTLALTISEYKYVADVEVRIDDLPPIVCNRGDLTQVLMNLIVNAAHAVEDAVSATEQRGTLTVAAKRRGDDVVITVADTGTGIPPEVATRIYDPFFTTKEVGRGTGQGLAITRMIVVEGHGGTLKFDTEPGTGTSFAVTLPIAGCRSRELETAA
jgi:signal transduction histidine kinase